MEGIRRAIECAVLAGRLESAAGRYDDKTSASLRRAAARYRRGSEEALAVGVAEGAFGNAPRPAGHTGLGSLRPADSE